MGLGYEEFELTESAYRHGYDDADVAEMLRRRHWIVQSRRGRLAGYEILGRNGAGRVVESLGVRVLRIFHLNRMSESEKRRFRRIIGQ